MLGEPFKQVELILEGNKYLVIWLPSSGLKEGNVINGAVINKVYNLILYKCKKCSKLLEENVIRCGCE